jgi:hypothetical protein
VKPCQNNKKRRKVKGKEKGKGREGKEQKPQGILKYVT